jgi:two-component system LytT family response regulator
MKMTCIIIDDEQHAIDLLKEHIGVCEDLDLLFTETSPVEGMKKLAAVPSPDIVFCDIDMPVMSGIDLASFIHSPSQLVFTTAYEQYSLQGYEVSAVDFMMKPVIYKRFRECVDRCLQRKKGHLSAATEMVEADTFFIRITGTKKLNAKLKRDNILYVESVGNYLRFHVLGEVPVESYMTFAQIEPILRAPQFVRTHRSFIVNTFKVKSFNTQHITLSGTDTKVPLAGAFKKTFLDIMQPKVFRTSRVG